MTTFYFATKNMEDYHHAVLKSMISVTQVRTDHDWEEVEDDRAQVTFVGMDAPDTAAWEGAASTLRVWCARAADSEADFSLAIPIRPDPLSRLLRALEMELGGDEATGEPATRAAVGRESVSAGEAFRRADGLLRDLDDIRAGGLHAALHIRNVDPTFPPPDLLIDGGAGEFVWPSSEDELVALCALPIDAIRGRKITAEAFDEAATGYERRPVAELPWLAAVHGSAGKPIEGVGPDKLVALEQRVGASGVLLRAEEKKLERALLDRARTPRELSDQLGVPQNQVYAFVNGCIALGAARVAAPE